MIQNDLRGKRATVMGLGLFGGGVAVAKYLSWRGMKVTVTDLRNPQELVESIEALKGISLQYRLGGHHESDFTDTDLVIANPAVRWDSPYLDLSRSMKVPIRTEIDLFLEACAAPTVAITGTNGKSTTTSLIGKITEDSKKFRRVWTGGNIGRSLLDVVEEIQAEDLIVLEVSSFQLETLTKQKCWPKVAVITQVGQDHLDRHGNFENYAKAKLRILQDQNKNCFAVLNAGDPVSSTWASQAAGKVLLYGEGGKDTFIKGDWIVSLRAKAPEKVLPIAEIPLLGKFNQENVMAAVAAAGALGIDRESIRASVKSFHSLPHRLEKLGEEQGTVFYNNAVSTTPESTISAIEALPDPIVLIAGGKDKNLDLLGLAQAIKTRVRKAVLYGAAAKALGQALSEQGYTQFTVVDSLGEGLDFLLPQLEKGDQMLFSPGFSSFDQYRNFQERGEEFRRRIELWMGRKTQPKSEKLRSELLDNQEKGVKELSA